MKQNTVYDPYNGDPKCDSQWLPLTYIIGSIVFRTE